MKRIFFVTAILFSVQFLSFGQENAKIGLSGSIQQSQFGILMPIWVGETFVLAPAFDLKYAEKVATDFSIGLVPRFYFRKEKLSPYIGFKFATLLTIPSGDSEIEAETQVDLMGGMAFGGEYFLTDIFSVGVEVQGNITKSDEFSYRFGNPDGVNFNTGTMISATLYF